MPDTNLVTIGEALEDLKGQNCEIHELLKVVLHRLVQVETQQNKQERILMAVSDDLASVKANLVTIGNGIVALDAKIVALQNTPGALDATDQAALTDIVTSSAALAATAANIPGVTPPTTKAVV